MTRSIPPIGKRSVVKTWNSMNLPNVINFDSECHLARSKWDYYRCKSDSECTANDPSGKTYYVSGGLGPWWRSN
jgi:hypothetical protein